jgi:hypothetical protein
MQENRQKVTNILTAYHLLPSFYFRKEKKRIKNKWNVEKRVERTGIYR